MDEQRTGNTKSKESDESLAQVNYSARRLAEVIVKWLGEQEHQGDSLLHSIIICDHASRMNFINSIANIIKEQNKEIYS